MLEPWVLSPFLEVKPRELEERSISIWLFLLTVLSVKLKVSDGER